jgi:hypothetical protein
VHDGCRAAFSVDDDGMTIAGHCIELLREKGPMTPEELGTACRWAKLTTARQPALSVRTALSWANDGRALRLGADFHLVTSLLDGRWLTLRRPEDPRHFDPRVDLACLAGVAERDGIPLAAGGSLRRLRYATTWAGPHNWAPDSEVVGIRLVDGVAEVAAVELDDDAHKRGDALVELLPRVGTGYSFGVGGRQGTLACDLLALVHDDPELLRAPVPPLRELVPQPAPPAWPTSFPPPPPPGRQTVEACLPTWLLDHLEEAAAEADMPVGLWLGDDLARLVAWPRRPVQAPTPGWDDPVPPSGRRQFGSLYAC